MSEVASARVLGRRGGLARARRLSAIDRRRIAALGAHARIRSLQAVRRIVANFRYAQAAQALRGGHPPRDTRARFRGPAARRLSRTPVTPDPSGYLETAAAVAADLRNLGLGPVLVGGMALVVLGSRRVTRDFDFVVRAMGDRLPEAIDALYRRGFELVSRLDGNGDVAATIANRNVAAARLRIDQPATAYFFNPETLLRIDLLFDFPLPADALAARATRMKIAGQLFEIASEPDLLELKRIANRARASAADAQDIAFLESRLKHRRKT